MLGVMTGKDLLIQLAQLHRGDRQVLGLETSDDLADELSFNGIGLQQDECAIRHRRQRYRRARRLP